MLLAIISEADLAPLEGVCKDNLQQRLIRLFGAFMYE